MSYAKVYAAQTFLLSPHIVTVEVDFTRGLHSFTIVGLPDKAVEEARDRVSAAIKNSGFASPKQSNRKIVVSLAPAELKKTRAIYDLSIALGYLLASEEITFAPEKKLFLGELSLDGAVQSVAGVLPLVREAVRCGFQEVYVPKANETEAALVSGITIYGVETLKEVVGHLDSKALEGETSTIIPTPETKIEAESEVSSFEVYLEDIRGQESGKRALEIAAAGGHNLALYGPPGTGKTLLAKALATLLPTLSFEDILEVTSIHSAAGSLGTELITKAPFRSPHHTASYVAMVGGGTFPRPGEITLAHRGVLFMDEFPEFEKRVIEALRQPLEDRHVAISRVHSSATFPANFILVAAMNPCPCGQGGEKCTCTPLARERYERKLSGPIIDRIDLWIEMPHVDYRDLQTKRKSDGEETKAARARVVAARERQTTRHKKGKLNAELSVREIEKHIPLDSNSNELLLEAAKSLSLSPRSYHRILKVARTIADLEGVETVGETHILEALQYRRRKS